MKQIEIFVRKGNQAFIEIMILRIKGKHDIQLGDQSDSINSLYSRLYELIKVKNSPTRFSIPGTEQISNSNVSLFPFSSSPLHLNR